jgi:hypothetical protein
MMAKLKKSLARKQKKKKRKRSTMAKVFSQKKYDALVQETIEQVQQLSSLKGGEYGGDSDRLANFRRNAERLSVNMETVWGVYAAKHWDAIQQYITDKNADKVRKRLESLAGRADDLIVYLILFKAILAEGSDE